MNNAIEINNLTKRYRDLVAVDHLCLDVCEGELFSLLGVNGAGKTTTIKMLTTLLAPTSGVCKVFGYDSFGQEKQIRRRINFIFGGEMGVYRRLSGRDNLRYFANLYLLDTETRERRINEILELVELTDAADRLAETYSKGMIQRLQIARGLINDPEILFMDEPTVGLDPLGARMLRDIIRKLRDEGKTVLLTTHYLPEAEELCDRMVILDHGEIVARGTPAEIKGDAATLEDAYVALMKGAAV